MKLSQLITCIILCLGVFIGVQATSQTPPNIVQKEIPVTKPVLQPRNCNLDCNINLITGVANIKADVPNANPNIKVTVSSAQKAAKTRIIFKEKLVPKNLYIVIDTADIPEDGLRI